MMLRRDYGRIGVGVTSPHLMADASGKRYVVKLSKNRVGVKALANEWLGYRLGRRCGLRLPRAGLAGLLPELVESSRTLGKVPVDAVHFASQYLAGCTYVGRQAIRQAVNKDEVVGAMLFDHLLCNEDRTLNRKNFLALWRGDKARIYAIDHSHLLGSGRWQAESVLSRAEEIVVNQRLLYGWLIRHYITRDRLKHHVERIVGIDQAEIEEMVAEVPPAWLSHTDREAFKQFWQIRQAMVTDIAKRLLSLAADYHRRAERYVVK